eukprot:TRINITY_DN10688_c0_g1_i1.p1 TRINITY_DN10688_c0_g1~~TRINITY_DN10688_c0_g1_i1.p1  ORF type:complete len:154 (+),score=16.19 TRINITY_DN10688_c0_g1_i1:340-801(+)
MGPPRCQRGPGSSCSYADELFAFKRAGDHIIFRRNMDDGRRKDMPSRLTPTTQKDAVPTLAGAQRTPRAANRESGQQLKPQLQDFIMQDRAPRDVTKFSHKRSNAVRLLYTLGHTMPAPEPKLEVVGVQQAVPTAVNAFSHRRSRTIYVRDGR